jgi:hypothetical protein
MNRSDLQPITQPIQNRANARLAWISRCRKSLVCNSTAYAYLRLLAPQLRLFKQPIIEICRKIASDKFEFAKHAVDQSTLNQIQVNEIKEAIARYSSWQTTQA